MERPAEVHPRYLERKLRVATEAQRHFESLISASRERFTGADRCLERFGVTVAALRHEHTGIALAAVDESHNELCIAEELLLFEQPRFTLVEYEPGLPAGERRIDFRATNDRSVWFVEVKTIHPDLKDRWDQYERSVQAGLIADNVTIHFERQGMGGELWHQKFASRSRMLEYSLELEERILEGGIDSPENGFVLALFTDGFAWHEDELEDFVAFYRTGRHRTDDGLAKMELHAIVAKQRALTRRISAFAYFCRPAFDVVPTEKNWTVHPPSPPW